ncbi:hypothetical protein GQ43DRAFT_442529 [Delitschia confertaspora ATCC 74209]|uniref:Uncharacterized protein n=1 Tax=Delitschia confertaspora ATCC 74209 TaxID=1513339 RepID=A0A9P4MWX4_9PLEO|nr:hypothetical protein GQ43DRAFT_442529 [Delitschia confertaspora ATCC 74209]
MRSHPSTTITPFTSTSDRHKHRDKRPYQPSITAYFDNDGNFANEPGVSDSGSSSGKVRKSSSAAKPNPAGFPTLPATVQSSLLNVGMRVRKSVPEGYKTHVKPTNLPSIQTTLSPVTIAKNVKPPRDPVPDAYQHARELLPFCGLHKVGGLEAGGLGFAEQPVTNAHLYDRGGTATNPKDKPITIFPLPAEAFNTPKFSSNIMGAAATLPNPTNPQKRAWEDEEGRVAVSTSEGFTFAFQMGVKEDEVPVSPLSATPGHSFHMTSAMGNGEKAALRPFAQPKTRKIGNVGGGMLKGEGMDIDLENAEDMDLGGDDFEEAGFLVGRREVEMSGA